MNAIDPSVIEDPETGKWWMHYGSYFGGLYCVELNPETGMTKQSEDHGHLIARRANYRKDNLEAPEIMYQPELGKDNQIVNIFCRCFYSKKLFFSIKPPYCISRTAICFQNDTGR